MQVLQKDRTRRQKLAASVKAIRLETERKLVAMTWQDDYNDEDPDTQTVYTIQSESVLSHDNIKTETALVSTVHVSSTSVLCDHCALASIFHHAPLLTNIRSCSPVKFSGVGGGIVVSKEGDFGDFGIVKYDPKASFNILSVDSLPDGAAVMYDHTSCRHTVLLDNITYHFDVPLGAKGLPLRDFHVQPPNSVSHVQLNTVSQNEGRLGVSMTSRLGVPKPTQGFTSCETLTCYGTENLNNQCYTPNVK